MKYGRIRFVDPVLKRDSKKNQYHFGYVLIKGVEPELSPSLPKEIGKKQ